MPRHFDVRPLAGAALLLAAAIVAPAFADHAGPAHHASMSDADMAREVAAWYASHPRVGNTLASSPGAVINADATFTASGFTFNGDANAGTPIDTVHITTGQSVLWQWVSGTHTVTSGIDSGDPQVGLEFDQPLNTSNRQFTHVFPSPGLYPFFCKIHELSNMRGYVEVTSPVGVPPLPPGARIGFAADPWPNPASSSVRFSFALAVDGRVRADVVDARGRFVATIVDRAHTAGTHAASWDGRGASGPASEGKYYLRLLVPGFTGGRSFVLLR